GAETGVDGRGIKGCATDGKNQRDYHGRNRGSGLTARKRTAADHEATVRLSVLCSGERVAPHGDGRSGRNLREDCVGICILQRNDAVSSAQVTSRLWGGG